MALSARLRSQAADIVREYFIADADRIDNEATNGSPYDMGHVAQLLSWRHAFLINPLSGSVVDAWVALLRFSPRKLRSALRQVDHVSRLLWLDIAPLSPSAPGPASSLGLKLFTLAQASINERSTEK